MTRKLNGRKFDWNFGKYQKSLSFNIEEHGYNEQKTIIWSSSEQNQTKLNQTKLTTLFSPQFIISCSEEEQQSQIDSIESATFTMRNKNQ